MKCIAIKIQILVSIYLFQEEYMNNIYKCAYGNFCYINLAQNTFLHHKKELEK